MKTATFNANSIRSRLDPILDWLRRNRPDILCVQETKVRDEEFPAQPFLDEGWNVVFRGEKAYNGVALISREPARDVCFGFDDGGPPDETRLLCATVGPVRVINTYVPQGRALDHPMYAYKLEWFARLKEYFARHFNPSNALLWTGDLNVAAEPIDVHHPERHTRHVCFHETIRRAFDECRAWGFTDVYRRFNPEPGGYTFFDYRQRSALENNLGWRIDYILATAPLARRATGAHIDMAPRRQPKPSDHTFLCADFVDQ